MERAASLFRLGLQYCRRCSILASWAVGCALDSRKTVKQWRSRLTCRNCRMPPLIRSESAAMPAIPSPGSRSCRSEAALGAAPVCSGQQQPEQQHADASGCELCRIMRALGDVVTNTGGGGAWHGQQWWPLFTLSLRKQKNITHVALHTRSRCLISNFSLFQISRERFNLVGNITWLVYRSTFWGSAIDKPISEERTPLYIWNIRNFVNQISNYNKRRNKWYSHTNMSSKEKMYIDVW